MRLEQPTFSLTLPPGFELSHQDQVVHAVSQEPPGVLTLTAEKVGDPADLPSLSRMLAGYLTLSGHPVATDELLSVSGLVGAQGYSWQYLEEGKYYRFWLCGNEWSWLLLTFVCPDSHWQHFHPLLNESLLSLSLWNDESAT